MRYVYLALAVLVALTIVGSGGYFGYLQLRDRDARARAHAVVVEVGLRLEAQRKQYPNCKAPVEYWVRRSALYDDLLTLLQTGKGLPTSELITQVRELTRAINTVLGEIDYACAEQEPETAPAPRRSIPTPGSGARGDGWS